MNLQKINGQNSVFETIKQINQQGQEFWSARDFQNILGYVKWDKFLSVLDKAKEACLKSGHKKQNHFLQVEKMVEVGSGAQRKIDDIILSRYACYLIVQNSDPTKPAVALGQTYFAIQTRKQELIEQADFADYAIFQDHGYKGLYGGLRAKDIHENKHLKKGQVILNHMGSTELAANLFRTTQTEDKIKRENIKGKTHANTTHFEVGKKVRQTIKELGGKMPEELPAPENIKKLKKFKEFKKLKETYLDAVGIQMSGVTKGKISFQDQDNYSH